MYIYDGYVAKQSNGKFLAVIFKIDKNKPNNDTVAEHETTDEREAMIWLDDELSRISTGKGVWDV